MLLSNISVPEGMRDRLFEECRAIKKINNQLAACFDKRGYSQVMTPSAEYYDVFMQLEESMEQASLLKLVDRSGRLLVLRPDGTVPIARVVGVKLQNSRPPYRFYYQQSVFRSHAPGTGMQTEVPQCGAELVGCSSLASDVEIIALAIEALRACGLSDFRLEIGYVGFFKALAAALGVEDEPLEQMRRLIEKKNFAALNNLLQEYDGAPEAMTIRKLPQLFGGEEVLAEALNMARVPQAVEAITYLKAIYDELKISGMAEHIIIDLGLVHQINYYTGLVFRGYAQSVGTTILSGGRYDRLMSTFGRDLPAVGFAIDINAVAKSLPQEAGVKLAELVYFAPEYFKAAWAYLAKAPAGSCQLAGCDSLAAAGEAAKVRGVPRLVIFDGQGQRAEEV